MGNTMRPSLRKRALEVSMVGHVGNPSTSARVRQEDFEFKACLCYIVDLRPG